MKLYLNILHQTTRLKKKHIDDIEEMIKRPVRSEASMPLTENISNSKYTHPTHTPHTLRPEESIAFRK